MHKQSLLDTATKLHCRKVAISEQTLQALETSRGNTGLIAIAPASMDDQAGR